MPTFLANSFGTIYQITIQDANHPLIHHVKYQRW